MYYIILHYHLKSITISNSFLTITPDETQVYTEAPVFPGTFQANPNSVVDRDPLGIVCVTFETSLQQLNNTNNN